MGKTQIAMAISILGVLLLMAGPMGILASNVATFAAFAAFFIAGGVWAFWPSAA